MSIAGVVLGVVLRLLAFTVVIVALALPILVVAYFLDPALRWTGGSSRKRKFAPDGLFFAEVAQVCLLLGYFVVVLL